MWLCVCVSSMWLCTCALSRWRSLEQRVTSMLRLGWHVCSADFMDCRCECERVMVRCVMCAIGGCDGCAELRVCGVQSLVCGGLIGITRTSHLIKVWYNDWQYRIISHVQFELAYAPTYALFEFRSYIDGRLNRRRELFAGTSYSLWWTWETINVWIMNVTMLF